MTPPALARLVAHRASRGAPGHDRLWQRWPGAGDDAVEARRLAEKYRMDVERFERLVRSVTVPSVREDGGAAVAAGSVGYVRDAESGEENPVKEVCSSFLSFSSTFFFDWFGLDSYVETLGRVEGAKTSQGRFVVRSSWVFLFNL